MISQGHLSSASMETSFSLVAQMVKSLVAAQETQVQSLGREDPLEKEMATHPLQYSCLENPMEGGTWWATVHRVAKSWTRLSHFTSLHHSQKVLYSYLHVSGEVYFE